MYSNYLAEVGKLVYLIGEVESTSTFKKMLESPDPKQPPRSKYFFKCVDELPPTAYRKVKVNCRRKGILRCDWFNKILDRSPMMIFMIFNFAQPLDKMEKWEDRLSVALKRINKVNETLRSTGKEEVILRIVLIVSKEAMMQGGSTLQKINNFLKNYEKELHVFQADQLTKEVGKNRLHWYSLLDKAYDKKYRTILKRKEETHGEKRLGNMIKMAVLTQTQNKKESYAQYDEAYKSLHFKYIESSKNKIDFNNFDAIREIRTIADIVLLRMLIVRMSLNSNFSQIPDIVSNHLKFFLQRDCDHYFNHFQNLIWRENFLHNFLEIVYTHEYAEGLSKSFLAQVINSQISMGYKLSQAGSIVMPELQKQEVKGRMIPSEEPVYIGSHNYTVGIEITEADILWSEMHNLVEQKKDFISRGMQIITRYKSMKLFRKNELSFFNTYLLRYYLADNKIGSMGNIFSQIINSKITRLDFYMLNNLIKELKDEMGSAHEHRVLIYGIAVVVADYFKSHDQLEEYGKMFMQALSSPGSTDLLAEEGEEQPQLDPIILPLISGSSICSLEVLLSKNTHPIEQSLEIELSLKFSKRFLLSGKHPLTLLVNFNHPQVKKEIKISGQPTDPIVFKIRPLDHFSKDQSLSITEVVLKVESHPTLHLHIANPHYPKYQEVSFYTKLQAPEITINSPYDIYYLYEISKFTIELGEVGKGVQLDAQVTVKEEDNAQTEIYTDMSTKLNLINSKCYQALKLSSLNIFYLKSNKLGPRALKFVFVLTVKQTIDSKELKNVHTITRDVSFGVKNLFRTVKILKECITGNEIKPAQVPLNKRILLAYSFRSNETVGIAQVGHNLSPKACIKTHKEIKPVTDLILTPDEKLKNVYIFEVKQDELDEENMKNLFLVSFYVKWYRVDMDMRLGLSAGEDLQNVYLERQVKIGVLPGQVEVEYEEGPTLRKGKKETLVVHYRNLSSQNIHVYSAMENSESILRIGEKGLSLMLGPHETKSANFEVLPIKIGYHSFPQVRSFFDGVESMNKSYNSILCVL